MFNTTLRGIALEPGARGKGPGCRLLEAIEKEAARLGRGAISFRVGPGPSAARDVFTHRKILRPFAAGQTAVRLA